MYHIRLDEVQIYGYDWFLFSMELKGMSDTQSFLNFYKCVCVCVYQ